MIKALKLLLFFTCSTLFSCTSSQIYDKQFKYELSTDKAEYVEGEDIYITMKITNIGNSVDSILFLGPDELLSNIEGLGPGGMIVDYFKDYYGVILPGETKVYSEKIDESYGNIGNNNLSFFRYIAAGQYTYRGNIKHKKGLVTSNYVMINVTKGSQEHQEAISEYLRINSLNFLDDKEGYLKEFSSFMKKYHDQILIEKALVWSIISRKTSGVLDDLSLVDDIKWFTDEYPDSKYVKYGIMTGAELIDTLRGSEEKKDFLRTIIINYPGTKAYQAAEEIYYK